MTTRTDRNPLVQLGKSGIASGVLTVILGVAALAWPAATIVVAAALFGAYLLISGVGQIVGAFGLPVSSTGGRVLMFVSGAASLILAALCFRDFSESVLLLSIWTGIGFVFRGTAAIVTSLSDLELPDRGWLAVSGALTVLAGFVMLAYPLSSLQALVLVAGVWLVVVGIGEILTGIRLRRHAD